MSKFVIRLTMIDGTELYYLGGMDSWAKDSWVKNVSSAKLFEYGSSAIDELKELDVITNDDVLVAAVVRV